MLLSPGKYHLKVPREYVANLKFRKSILEACHQNRENQLAIIEACRTDLLFFVNFAIVQFNPLLKGELAVGPFITWEFQDRALLGEEGIVWCYENNRTAVVEKSREMGASWLFLIFQLWLCLFHPHIQVLNISRSAEAVESASRNSLFAKIRFMLEHLPDWLTGIVDVQKNTFQFARTGSEITGEASTGRAGTGGRASVVFVDEFSEVKEDVKVRQNTASVADCRFFNGTHLGVETEFYNLTQSPECVQIQIHWTRHPRKNKSLYSWDVEAGKPQFWTYNPITDEIEESDRPEVPMPEDYQYDRTGAPAGGPHPGIRSLWYDKKAGEIGTSRQVAMELDINPSGSSSQFYEALMIRKLQSQCKDPFWTGSLSFDDQLAVPHSLNPAQKGPLILWLEPGLDRQGKLNHVTPSTYIIAADLGTGNGATPSCLTMFDCERGLKVGSYVDSWKDPKEMAWIAVSLARLFKDRNGESAFLAWECPGPGITFGNEVVREIGYKNIYWKVDDFNQDAKETSTPGWFSSARAKPHLHTEYQSALKTGKFVNWDYAALGETLQYVHINGSVDHPRGKKSRDPAAEGANHGDRVVADGLAWLMAKKKDVPRIEEKPVTVAAPNSIGGRMEYNRLREREKAGMWR